MIIVLFIRILLRRALQPFGRRRGAAQRRLFPPGPHGHTARLKRVLPITANPAVIAYI
jgi:hypothetical protein